MQSPAIAMSVSPAAVKAKGGPGQASEDDAKAFSMSLEVAREEAGGETETTSITIQTVTTGSGAAGTGEPAAAGDMIIEIETVVFSGEDLAENLRASTVLGGGSVALNEDGSFGVAGSISGENEVRLEVGETLTFDLPPSEGEVVGGQVTITNLFGDGETAEGALVFAYDADGRQLACYCALGDETGSVTVDIDVPFARLDFKALDNGSWRLEDNANFGVGKISALFASVVEDLAEGASQLIDDVLTRGGIDRARLVDFGHFGKVSFEVNRVSTQSRSIIDALNGVSIDRDKNSDDTERDRLDPGLRDRAFAGARPDL